MMLALLLGLLAALGADAALTATWTNGGRSIGVTWSGIPNAQRSDMVILTYAPASVDRPPFKYHWVIQADKDGGGWSDGAGAISFEAVNVRRDLAVAYLRFNTTRTSNFTTAKANRYKDYDILESVMLSANGLGAPHNVRLTLEAPRTDSTSAAVVRVTWHASRKQDGWCVLTSSTKACLDRALAGQPTQRACRGEVWRQDVRASPDTWTGADFCPDEAGNTSTAQGVGFVSPGFVYSVRLDDLSSNEEYFYAVRGPGGVASDVRSFRTAPRAGSERATRMLIAADVGTNSGGDRSNMAESYTWTTLNEAAQLLGCMGPTQFQPPYPGFGLDAAYNPANWLGGRRRALLFFNASGPLASLGNLFRAHNTTHALRLVKLGHIATRITPLIAHTSSVVVPPVMALTPTGHIVDTGLKDCSQAASGFALPFSPPIPIGNMIASALTFGGAPMGGQQSGTAATHAHLNDLAAQGRYQASLVVGDVAYAQGYAFKWDNFFQQLGTFYSRVPGLFASGNHESADVGVPNALSLPKTPGFFDGIFDTDAGGECGVAYDRWTRMPGLRGTFNGRERIVGEWHAETVGNVRFINFNTDQDWVKGSLQYDWLVAQLKASITARREGRYRWLVLAFHRPMYVDAPDNSTRGDLGIALRMQAELEPLFSAYQVDLTLAGHTHYYLSTHPVAKMRVVPRDSNVHGVVHVVLGNGGFQNPPLLLANKPDWIRAEHFEFGICELEATRRRLTMQCYNSTSPGREVLDRVELTKPEYWRGPRRVEEAAAAYAAWAPGSPPSDAVPFDEAMGGISQMLANKASYDALLGALVQAITAGEGGNPFALVESLFGPDTEAGRLLEAAPGATLWGMRDVWRAAKPIVRLAELWFLPAFTSLSATYPEARQAVQLFQWIVDVNKEGSGRVWRLAFTGSN